MSQEDKLYSLLVKISQRIVKEDSEDKNSLLSKIAHYVVEETSTDENETAQPKEESVYEDKKLETDIVNNKTPKRFKGLNDLPEIITAQHIADYLNISRQRVYELFLTNPKYGGIPSFSIGASKRTNKSDFIAWLKVCKETTSWDKNRNFVRAKPWEINPK